MPFKNFKANDCYIVIPGFIALIFYDYIKLYLCMDIKTSNKPKTFENRMKHNGRLKNLSTSQDKEYKNIIFIDNREDYKFKNDIAKSEDKAPSKSKIGKSISRLRDRQKKAQKQATKNKLQLQIDALIEQRDRYNLLRF